MDAAREQPGDGQGGEPQDLTFETIQHAKRRHGALGGALAAGMLGLDQAMSGRKAREEAPIVIDANSDPIDVDTDGITIDGIDGADGSAFVAPPLPRTPPKVAPPRRRWR